MLVCEALFMPGTTAWQHILQHWLVALSSQCSCTTLALWPLSNACQIQVSFVVAAGYRITACAATDDQCAFVLSQPRKILPDETQETLRTSQFPSQHVKVRRVSAVLVLFRSFH